MKKYDLTKPKRKKKADRVLNKKNLPLFYTQVTRVGVDGKPSYIHTVTKAKALRLLDPKIKRSVTYKFIGRVA